MSAKIFQRILKAIKQQLETLLVPTEPKLIPIKVRLNETSRRRLR